MRSKPCPLQWEDVFGVECPIYPKVVAVSPDGLYLAIADDPAVLIVDRSGILANRVLRDDKEPLTFITDVVFFPDGRHVVTCSDASVIKVWSVESCKIVARYDDSTYTGYSVVVFPDGRRIASGHSNLVIWDAFSGECRKIINIGPSNVSRLTLSLDAKRIICSFLDSTRIFDVESGNVMSEFFCGPPSIPADMRDPLIDELDLDTECEGRAPIAISPDGKLVAAASLLIEEADTLRVWNVDTGEIVYELVRLPKQPERPNDMNRGVTKLFFLVDNKHLAIQREYSDLEVWIIGDKGEAELCGEKFPKEVLCTCTADGAILVTNSRHESRIHEYMVMEVDREKEISLNKKEDEEFEHRMDEWIKQLDEEKKGKKGKAKR